jgi:hypothetical protein
MLSSGFETSSMVRGFVAEKHLRGTPPGVPFFFLPLNHFLSAVRDSSLVPHLQLWANTMPLALNEPHLPLWQLSESLILFFSGALWAAESYLCTTTADNRQEERDEHRIDHPHPCFS